MKKEYDFSKLKKADPAYLRRTKAAVTMRLDASVVGYFRSLAERTGMPYQTIINYVLKEYASSGLIPSANWPKRRPKRSA
jgi:uncharacterized protein (DUF4415 family)